MSLESIKIINGIAALFIAVGYFIPFIGLIGIIMLLIGVKKLSDYYGEPKIFQNTLYGFIFGLIGVIIAGLILFSALISFESILTSFEFKREAILRGFTSFLISLMVLFVFFLLKAIFYRKSFILIADKTGDRTFDTVGTLLLIGAVLTIIIVGLLIMFIAWIIAAIAFLSIKSP